MWFFINPVSWDGAGSVSICWYISLTFSEIRQTYRHIQRVEQDLWTQSALVRAQSISHAPLSNRSFVKNYRSKNHGMQRDTG